MAKKPRVIRLTKTEFELDDGRVYQHAIELEPDEVPTIEEFQGYYDHWLSLLGNNDDRTIVNHH
ncbi:hypothetical protein [Merismopedia glauca]|uniref:Uncharacterized protein n=1 Tax=Merismopedia glauca CCAP 1448/3 TaxID=1296344 RepID=A0A2T1C0K7_9CYAN|nr:hypothetical protein [Merismopedia glauca]PSB01734.1 hypothetical protein C7B64_16775 [Merismopedia glauca CCAP 1448/3]